MFCYLFIVSLCFHFTLIMHIFNGLIFQIKYIYIGDIIFAALDSFVLFTFITNFIHFLILIDVFSLMFYPISLESPSTETSFFWVILRELLDIVMFLLCLL